MDINDPGRMAEFRRRLAAAGLAEPRTAPTPTPDAASTVPAQAPGPVRRELHPTEAGLWFLDKLHPGSTDYVVALAVRIDGDLDLARLAESWRWLVARHPALRTRFGDTGGVGWAEVVPAGQVPAADLIREPVDDVDDWLRRSAAEPFDLPSGVPARLRLAADGAVDGDRTIALLTAHHIVVDGAALDTLVTELFSRYAGASPPVAPAGGGAPPAAPDPATGLEWWRSALAGAAPTPVPGAAPAAAGRVPRRGRRVGTDLDAELDAVVDRVAREHAVSRPVVFAAAYRVVLRTLLGAEDIVVGTPVNLRGGDLRGTVGNLVNLVCLRNPTTATTTVAQLLQGEQQALVAAVAHRDTPFEQVVRELSGGVRHGDAALVRAVFSHHRSSAAPSSAQIAGLTVTRVDVDLGTAKFDLTLQVEEAGPDSRIWLEYDVSALPDEAARSLLDTYRQALVGLAAPGPVPLPALAGGRPAAPAGDDWTPRGDRGVVGWFERIAAATPDRTAVSDPAADEPATVSYGELDQWADRVADQVTGGGPGPVAVLTGRTPAMVAAIVGVAKAGATYLPVDPEHPDERIRQLLCQAGVHTVVVDGSGRSGALPAGVRVVDVDQCRTTPPPGAAPVDRARPPIHWATPLYRIYTSGSTGRPKGVEVAHANLGALIDGARESLGLTADDRWALFHSIAFDLSVWETWAPLVTGATVVLVDRATARTPEDLARLLDAQRVTVLDQTPTAFGSLAHAVTEGHVPLPAALRLVVLAGEALRPTSLAAWFATLGADSPRLVNMYGITETTVHTTWRDITEADVERGGSPIGVPLPKHTVTVVDADLNPAPAGFAGELLVGGAAVSLGYAGAPALTASRFVPDPAGRGRRAYRSGDRARRGRDGELEFLGRIDAQLKVRGYRIEPAEVERTLVAHPGVAAAGVVAARTGRTGVGLVGFVVTSASASVSLAQVRAFAAERLPDHMVPRLHQIDRLPYTVNGKLDRPALTRRAEELADRRSDEAAPTDAANECEQAVVAIWRDLLGVGSVGVRDNFFGLGGDSILAVQVAAAMSAAGVPVRVADIFEHPTIRQLVASSVGASADAAAGTDVDPADAAAGTDVDLITLLHPEDQRRLPATVTEAYPLTLLQQGMLFHQLDQNSYLNATTTRVTAPVFDGELLRQAFDRVVQRHPVLRSGFDLASYSEPLQLVHRHVPVELPVVDWRGRAEDEIAADLKQWMTRQRIAPVDLSRPPLIRFTAHRISDTDFWFTAVECHAAMDGWSFTSTLAEVLEEYDQVCAAARDNRPLRRLDPPAESFGRYVWRERAALGDPAAAAAVREIIARAEPVTIAELAGGGAGPRDRTLVPLNLRVQRGLELAATRLGVPVKSVLLAAHAVVMSVLNGTATVTLGLVVNGRPETAGGVATRGLYLNTLPMNVTVTGRTLGELAQACLAEESRLLRLRTYPGVAAELAYGRDQLMTTAFNYTRFHALKRASSGGDVRRVGHLDEDAPTNYPLYVSFDHGVADDSDHLAMILLASERHFTDAAVRALTASYLTVLTAMSRDPSVRVADLELAPDRPVDDAASTDHLDRLPALPELILNRVDRWPTEVAVHDLAGTRLTYAELADAVGAATARLRAAGVRRGDRIGVCLPRDAQLVVAILAVLASGAVYVPLDPDLPAARQRQIHDLAGLRHVLVSADTRHRLDTALPALDLATLPGPDADQAADADQIDTDPVAAGRPQVVATAPEELAYLMFTSGSTGQPKGVMVAHRALAAFDAAVGERFGPGQVILAATNASFDISVAELLLPLAHGSGVAVLDRRGRFDPDEFATLVRRAKVTTVQATPSLWTELIAAGVDLDGIEAWTGGEALTAALGRELTDRATAVHNWYGPTETTIWSTVLRVAEDDLATAVVPVGRALPGETAYVLGAGLRHVPDEMAGELFIGGAGLARGYLDDPGLTALRFVPDPYGRPGQRMYRTGDRARRRSDGVLDFAGRIDDQLKFNGHRIEPGEVEAALGELAGVARAAVAVRDGHLVAFVVPAGGEVDLADLRARVRSSLPGHMVPRLVAVESLPLNANGKVDRRRLPDAVFTRQTSAARYAAPADDTEQVLAEVWREVLGVDRVGRFDNFLDLGGDSITALRVVARANARGVRVSLADLFSQPDLAGTAAGAGRATTGVRPTAPAGVDLHLSGLDERSAHDLVARLSRDRKETAR